MQLQFSKMHGLGNDFIVVDNVTQNVFLSPDKIRQLANRNFGIGFDQLLVVEPPYDPEMDFHYRIFNADGSEVEQCGNGARCFAHFVRLKGLTNKHRIGVSTARGNLLLHVEQDGNISVNMGRPEFEPAQIPFQARQRENTYLLNLGSENRLCSVLSMGNPHCVLEVNDVKSAEVERLGKLINSHERFPDGVNVGFMQIMSPDFVRLRVFERGVGETLACGTGACAAMAAGRQQGKLGKRVTVELPGGRLSIRWDDETKPVRMTGPAEHVFDGLINL